MTSTDKKVTRVTTRAYASSIIGRKARKVVTTILPGDTLCLRLLGTQQREHISIADVFETARSRRVMSERMQKINAKRRAA